MGVVNASPESFSDAGRFSTLDSRLELAAALIEAGADVLDVGGQSAITGVPEIDADQEIEPTGLWRCGKPERMMSGITITA